MSIEGGMTFGNSSVSNIPPPPTATNHLAARAGVAFGMRFDPYRDWRARLAFTQFGDASAASDFVTVQSGLKYATADLELGFHRSPSHDATLAVRSFAGARALYVQDSADKAGDHWSSQYAGIGPRLGTSVEKRLADGPWGLTGSVAGAAIVGTRDARDKSGDTTVSTETVLNLEGAVGLTYQTSHPGKLTLGVRAEQWWNLRPGDPTGQVTISRDALTWGPFVKFELEM